MPAEASHRASLQIGHVLFVDIVGYSKLLINEQQAGVHQLNEAVRSSNEFRRAEAQEKLTRLPTGDGVALIFYTNPEAPVRCAVEISEALRSHPQLKLRMGVHSGPVSPIKDLNKQANVAGGGINTAQRVMACGDAGHILLSRRVAEDLEQFAEWQPYLHELGEVEVKHGAKIEIFNLCGDAIGNPNLPEKIAHKRSELETAARAHARRSRLRRRATLASLLGAGVVAIALSIIAYRTTRKLAEATAERTAATLIPEKSVAVLPFENLSPDPENAFLTEGIQDEIITRLAKIAALKVISRTSTKHYESKPANLTEIAKQLGVATFLEGSVQKLGDVLRVNVQLVKVATNRSLWAETYDRKLIDIFGVESEVATEIASALRATLTPEEKERVEKVPTKNLEAWAAYLRARALSDAHLGGGNVKNYRDTQELYKRAILLDPGFALAHAALSDEYSYWFIDIDPAEEEKVNARAEADEALQLERNLGEAHEAFGNYFYRVERDYTEASKEYAVALRALPNDAELLRNMALMARRQGHWREAISTLKRAISLNPRSLLVNDWLVNVYQELKQWPAAKEAMQHSLILATAISPESAENVRRNLAFLELNSTGNLDAIRHFIAGANSDTTEDQYWLAMCERDFDTAERVLAQAKQTEFDIAGNPHAPKSYQMGCVVFARGDTTRAKGLFEQSLPNAEAEAKANPNGPRYHSYLGLVFSFLGRKEDAIRAAKHAVELMPESKDAVEGAKWESNLALVYARVGEIDQAMALIEHLLTTPAAEFNVTDLRLWWEWDPLRKDPRFQKIVSSPEPKVIYN